MEKKKEQQQKSIRYLSEILSDYKILIDATVVLDKKFPVFVKNIRNVILTQGKKCILMMPGKENNKLVGLKDKESAKKNILDAIEKLGDKADLLIRIT